ncbi:MAG: hypothetical protein QM589_11435 [Thermomicrobiales bacterium]
MGNSSFTYVRSISSMLVIVAATLATLYVTAQAVDASPAPSPLAGIDGVLSALAWLKDEVEDLLMIIQDSAEGWTWA